MFFVRYVISIVGMSAIICGTGWCLVSFCLLPLVLLISSVFWGWGAISVSVTSGLVQLHMFNSPVPFLDSCTLLFFYLFRVLVCILFRRLVNMCFCIVSFSDWLLSSFVVVVGDVGCCDNPTQLQPRLGLHGNWIRTTTNTTTTNFQASQSSETLAIQCNYFHFNSIQFKPL